MVFNENFRQCNEFNAVPSYTKVKKKNFLQNFNQHLPTSEASHTMDTQIDIFS